MEIEGFKGLSVVKPNLRTIRFYSVTCSIVELKEAETLSQALSQTVFFCGFFYMG